MIADDTSLFSVIDDVDVSSEMLTIDLLAIQEWTYNWKMSFNPDKNIQAQEVVFSRKVRNGLHPNLYFNDKSVARSVTHKHPGLTLDKKLSFTNCINDKTNKTFPPGMRRRSDVSLWYHLGWDVADHIETSSRHCY